MISAIVCADANFGIGCQGKLLDTIPEDMKFFKKKTNNSIVIMGRKTYDSLPNKPLSDRVNIVITSNIDDKNLMEVRKEGIIYTDIDAIKGVLENSQILPWDIYIIGGGTIYKELLPYCERIYITKILHAYDNVDTYFPNIDAMLEWILAFESDIKEYNGIKYKFCVYDRYGKIEVNKE